MPFPRPTPLPFLNSPLLSTNSPPIPLPVYFIWSSLPFPCISFPVFSSVPFPFSFPYFLLPDPAFLTLLTLPLPSPPIPLSLPSFPVFSLCTSSCFPSLGAVGVGKGTLSALQCLHLPATLSLPSVLWRYWLGGRKGIQPVKNWGVGCWRGYLSGARCRLAYGPADATATHCLLLQ